MGCLKCDRQVHPDSPEALTAEFACAIKDGMCLRVNCNCLECGKDPGIWCSKCGGEIRPGSRPGVENFVCRTCSPYPSPNP
jgi:hypothetical protein